MELIFKKVQRVGIWQLLTFLLPSHDVLQEVDRDLVVVRDVEAAVDGDEIEDLAL